MICPTCGTDNEPDALYCKNPDCDHFFGSHTPAENVSAPTTEPVEPTIERAAEPVEGLLAGDAVALPTKSTPGGTREPVTPSPEGRTAPVTPRARPNVQPKHAGLNYTIRPRAEPQLVEPVVPVAPPSQLGNESRSADNRSALYLEVDDASASIAPGAEHVVRLRIRNTGSLVEAVDLRVEGLPEDWTRFDPTHINLDLGAEQTVLLRIRPPHDTSTESGIHTFEVVAWSQKNPQVRVAAVGSLRVAEYGSLVVAIDTPSAVSRSGAAYVVSVTNDGNVAVPVALDVSEPTRRVRIAVTPGEATIAPGATESFQVGVTPDRPLIRGTPLQHQFTVTASGRSAAPATVTGVLTQNPWVPRWAPKVAAIVMLVAASAVGLWARNWYQHRPTSVPDVTQKTEQAAKLRLGAAGFAVDNGDAVFNEEPAGVVVRQDPKGGPHASKQPHGSKVVLTLSKGPRPVQLPSNLVGLQYADAARLLEGLKLNVVRSDVDGNSAMPVGAVVSVKPDNPNGQSVIPGQRVVVEVSRGIEVPQVAGDLNAAEAALRALGLLYRTVPDVPVGQAPISVTAQSPVAGSRANPRDVVVLFVSAGGPTG
jgi:beta-lactam-binding protein with PASTA domain